MTTYKVHIKTECDTTTYTTNAVILATVTYRAAIGEYSVTVPDGKRQARTAEEADNAARESITAFLATLGIVPEFITFK